MPNSALSVDKIAKRALPLLREQLLLGRAVNRDQSLVNQQINQVGGAKTGGTLRIRKPHRWTVRENSASYSAQNIEEEYTTVPEPEQHGVDFELTSKELSIDIEVLAERHLVPAMAQLATYCDGRICNLYKKVANTVGTPGTTPNALSIVGNAMQRADELNWPMDGNRWLFFTPAAKASMADAMKGTFLQGLTEEAVRRGETGQLMTFRTGMANGLKQHTTGTFSTGSTPLVDGAVAADAQTIATDGWATSTLVLKAGDVFTISASNTVYEVNPMTRDSTGVYKQFVALSDVTSDSNGDATIRVVPSDDSNGLNFSGAYQNMSAQIANDATISVWGANGGLGGAGAEATVYPINLAFHKDAFWQGFFPLDSMPGTDSSTVTDPKSGISIRLIRYYDGDNDKLKHRFDILVSQDTLRPELACRVVG